MTSLDKCLIYACSLCVLAGSIVLFYEYKSKESKQVLIFRAMETNQCEDVLNIIKEL